LKPGDEADKGSAKKEARTLGRRNAHHRADFMMSLDNVIAVAGSAHGSVFLLIAGLLISMPLLMTAGASSRTSSTRLALSST